MTVNEAREFLAFDLRDSADIQRNKAHNNTKWAAEFNAAAERPERLADDVELLSPELLKRYAAARSKERLEVRRDSGDTIHCSMTMEIGFLLHPQTIDDVCEIYVRAIELVAVDPRWRDPDSDMYYFWREYAQAAYC